LLWEFIKMADSGDVVKRITITATGVDIDSTTASVNALSDAYTNAANKSSDALSVLGGVGAIGGLIAGLTAALDLVGKMNSSLADIATVANQVGLSLKDLQGVQFSGALQGLSTDQINAGLQQASTLLNDASRNSNSLSKELTANGLSVKDANGQLITQNQLLVIAGNLVANAKNPGDQNAIADMLGYGKELVPVLEQGGTAMAGIGDAAQAAGAVINDETIQRATQFDTEWRQSSVQFSTYMKSAMADLLPYIDDLIAGASKFMASFKMSDVQSASDQSFKDFSTQTGIPDSGVIKIDADGLSTATKEFQNAPIFSTDTWINFGKAIAAGFNFMSPETAANTIPGYAASQITEPTYPTEDQMNKAFSASSASGSAAAMDKAQDAAQDLADKFSEVAAKGSDANDMLDKAENTLKKHTDQTAADADAVGLGAGALAGMRGEATLLSAALANGTTVTPALTAKFKDLADQAADAADDLAKVQVASVISRGSQTAFLSPEDVTIANQLKTVFGDDIPAAMASSQAAALRMNATFATINTTIRTGATTFATDFVESLAKGATLMASLETGAAALGNTLIAAGLKTLVTDGLNALSGPASSLASGVSQTASATSSATILTAAGTALAASMVAGATSAAAILAGGGTTAAGVLTAGGTAAGVGVDVGTSVGGATLVTSGAAAGGFIETAAAVLGVSTAALTAVMGPLAAVAAVAAGVGMVLGAKKQVLRNVDSPTSEAKEENVSNNYSKAA
jgi:hypothetical protein